jgi:hypothetical protein
MTITARTLTRTLATLAIATSTVSSVLYGATNAAYAAHVDSGHALLHGHRVAVHTSRSRTGLQFRVHPHCYTCAWRHPELSDTAQRGTSRGKQGSTMKARLQDAAAAEATVLAQQLTSVLASHRLGDNLPCGFGCRSY